MAMRLDIENKIYVLRDPVDGWVKYVGATTQRLTDRRCGLVSQAWNGNNKACPLNTWLRGLKAKQQRPLIEEIEVTIKPAERERYWIAHYRQAGAPLFNIAHGGPGILGLKHRPETLAKLKAVWAGLSDEKKAERVSNAANAANRSRHLPSTETSKKIKAARLGMKATPETRTKMSVAQTGRKHTPETRAKMSAAQTGRKHTPETRAKMSAARSGQKMSPKAVAKQIGRRHTAETKAKISAAKTGRGRSPEAVARSAAGNSGKKRGPEALEHIREGIRRRDAKKREMHP